MDNQTIFWILLGVAVLLAMCLVVIGYGISTLADSDFFRKRLKELKEKSKNATPLLVIAFLLIPGALLAKAPEQTSFEPTLDHIWLLVGIDATLLTLCIIAGFYLMSVVKAVREEQQVVYNPEEELDLNKILTDVVPIEEEHTILMDHEYDGIQELDNNLPPWWKWGFYLTIVIGIAYLTYYHIAKTGKLQVEEYQEEMAEAQARVDAYNALSAGVTEANVTQLMDEATLSQGKSMFETNCVTCHGAGGRGNSGPNLTDQYWLYGGSVSDVFKTVKYGAKNGMKAWKDDFNGNDLQKIVSYVLSLQGSNPEGAKPPQGELYVPEGTTQNTDTAAVDSVK